MILVARLPKVKGQKIPLGLEVKHDGFKQAIGKVVKVLEDNDDYCVVEIELTLPTDKSGGFSGESLKGLPDPKNINRSV